MTLTQINCRNSKLVASWLSNSEFFLRTQSNVHPLSWTLPSAFPRPSVRSWCACLVDITNYYKLFCHIMQEIWRCAEKSDMNQSSNHNSWNCRISLWLRQRQRHDWKHGRGTKTILPFTHFLSSLSFEHWFGIGAWQLDNIPSKTFQDNAWLTTSHIFMSGSKTWLIYLAQEMLRPLKRLSTPSYLICSRRW